MAVMQLAFTSQYLHVNTNVAVVLPDMGREEIPRHFYRQNQEYRVLWLLPELECNHSKWLRQTNVERYACQQKTAVVMPSAENSDYLDWNSFSTGLEADSFFFKELMPLVQAWLPVSSERYKNAIAGPTDAPIRLALEHPERFAAGFQLRGPLTDYEALLDHWPPLQLLAQGQEAACRRWREAAKPEALRLLNLVDNFGGKKRFLSSGCNVRRTLENLTRESHAMLPNLHFLAGQPDEAFQVFLRQLADKGIPADFCRLPAREEGWAQLDCAIETVLKQFGEEAGSWR